MSNPTCDEALRLSSMGLSVLPIKHREKKPTVKSWKSFQTSPATAQQIQTLFVCDRVGLAIILGNVSGNLIARDFDDENGYLRWADKSIYTVSVLCVFFSLYSDHYCQKHEFELYRKCISFGLQRRQFPIAIVSNLCKSGFIWAGLLTTTSTATFL